jgi:hypothetical protein
MLPVLSEKQSEEFLMVVSEFIFAAVIQGTDKTKR